MGAHDFKYNKCLCFCSKNREYQYYDVCCPKTSSCASKPLLLRSNQGHTTMYVPSFVKIERGSDGDLDL